MLESPNWKMYYDRAILTDKTIHYNRPDLYQVYCSVLFCLLELLYLFCLLMLSLIDKINKQTYLIDITIPNTHNLQKSVTEKINKYTELKEEVTRIWKMEKVYIVPLVLFSTGVIPKSLLHYIEQIKLPTNIYITMQKAAILNTCRIVRKFLQEDITFQPILENGSHLA